MIRYPSVVLALALGCVASTHASDTGQGDEDAYRGLPEYVRELDRINVFLGMRRAITAQRVAGARSAIERLTELLREEEARRPVGAVAMEEHKDELGQIRRQINLHARQIDEALRTEAREREQLLKERAKILSDLKIAPNHCDIHSVPLVKKEMPIRYGLTASHDRACARARITLFRYCGENLSAGCTGVRNPKSADVLVCPSCLQARQEWLQEQEETLEGKK